MHILEISSCEYFKMYIFFYFSVQIGEKGATVRK